MFLKPVVQNSSLLLYGSDSTKAAVIFLTTWPTLNTARFCLLSWRHSCWKLKLDVCMVSDFSGPGPPEFAFRHIKYCHTMTTYDLWRCTNDTCNRFIGTLASIKWFYWRPYILLNLSVLTNPQPPSALSLKYVLFCIIIFTVIHIYLPCQPAVCSSTLYPWPCVWNQRIS